MKPHEHILRMIESVDPADTETLDQIDVLVTEYATPNHFPVDGNGNPCTWEQQKAFLIRNGVNPAFPFTRSRDALKAIRPEGWELVIRTKDGFVFIEKINDKDNIPWKLFLSLKRQSEELAELHAIIKAIAYERGEESPVCFKD